jgi:hypothetical protein
VQYGAAGGFPTSTSPGPKSRGKNFFAGGPDGANVVAVQTISLSAFASAIKAGDATFTLSGWLGGYADQGDEAFVELDWKDASGDVVGTSATLGPVTAAQRDDVTGMLKRATSGSVPSTARKAYLQLSLTRVDGSYNDGYADNLSLIVKTP